MPTATADTAEPLKKRDRVVAAVDLKGVPEGTPGRVKVLAGLGPWMRCWVEFENGIWMGSISSTNLVLEDNWATFQEQRVADAEAAALRASQPPVEVVAAAPTGEAADGAGAAGGADDRVPAHLLARSASARARLAAKAAEEG